MLKRMLAGCAALFVAGNAAAIGPGFHLAGYYEDDSLELSAPGYSSDLDVDGFGVRGMFKSGFNWLAAGEYTALEIDGGTDYTDMRIGGGYAFDVTPLASFYGQLDYVMTEAEYEDGGSADDDGVAAYFGGEVGLLKLVSAHARAGYLMLDDYSGPEMIVGGTLTALPLVRVFAEYRWMELEDDDFEETLDGFRLGVRFAFNN